MNLVSVRFSDSVSTSGWNLIEPASSRAIWGPKTIAECEFNPISLPGSMELASNWEIANGKKETTTRKRIFVRTITGAYLPLSVAGHFDIRVIGGQRISPLFGGQAKSGAGPRRRFTCFGDSLVGEWRMRLEDVRNGRE